MGLAIYSASRKLLIYVGYFRVGIVRPALYIAAAIYSGGHTKSVRRLRMQ